MMYESIMVDNERLMQVPCKFCNGIGKLSVTKDMLLDAGILNGATWEEICPYCFGDGYIIETIFLLS